VADLRLRGADPPARDARYGLVDLDGTVRRYRFDLGWPDLRLAVEVQGGVWSRGAHGRPSNLERDAEKAALAAARGWTVVPITNAMIRSGRGLRLVLAVLERLRTTGP